MCENLQPGRKARRHRIPSDSRPHLARDLAGTAEYVRLNLRACLTPEQRIRCLTESQSAANASSAACERKLGERRAGRRVTGL